MAGGDNAMDLTPDKNGGVLKEIIKEGVDDTRLTKGMKVKVHYIGCLTDGTQFESSRDRGEQPLEFILGIGQVIKGWDIGIASMKKGEQAYLTCRSDYAYGKKGGPPNLPPDSTLVFEVELVDWEPENLSSKEDAGILRYPIEAGTGVVSPKDGATVEVTLVGEVGSKVFFDKRISFSLGEGVKFDVPPGIEKALEKMEKGEKSRIELKPQYGWDTAGHPGLGVPSNASLTYTVTLHSFDILKDIWILSTGEKLTRAAELKEKGTKYFKEGDMDLAIKMYSKILDLIKCSTGCLDTEVPVREKLILDCYLNLSICFLKVKSLPLCIQLCDSALKLDNNSVKALFRRGQALLGLNEPILAKADFRRVLELEPENTAAAAQINQCQICAAQIKETEKKIYANMFDKFARKDKEREEEEARRGPDVLEKVGEWGSNERDHDPTDFEKENPNILMLNKDGQFKDM